MDCLYRLWGGCLGIWASNACLSLNVSKWHAFTAIQYWVTLTMLLTGWQTEENKKIITYVICSNNDGFTGFFIHMNNIADTHLSAVRPCVHVINSQVLPHLPVHKQNGHINVPFTLEQSFLIWGIRGRTVAGTGGRMPCGLRCPSGKRGGGTARRRNEKHQSENTHSIHHLHVLRRLHA